MNPQDLYLVRKGHGYFAAVKVPAALREIVGKARITRTLNTRDIVVARKRKGAVVEAIRAEIAAAQVRHEATKKEGLALVLGDALDAWKRGDDGDPQGAPHEDTAEAVAAAHGDEIAKTFHEIATGGATPLLTYVESWLASTAYTERTKMERRAGVRKLAHWLGANATVEAVSGREAARFRDEALVGRGVHPKTGNKTLSILKSYWQWLGASEYLGEDWRNPWDNKRLANTKARSVDDKERPFTNDELARLLEGDGLCRPADLEVIRIAALTGCRLEEIFQMRVRHTRGGVFQVGHKTAAALRKVPIHSGLMTLVAKLVKGKGDDDFLIDAPLPASKHIERSMPFSKRFHNYRKRLGIDDMTGQGGRRRRSRVNFHSLRRWFITACEDAGVQETMAMRVVGHEIKGMSYGVYSGGVSIERLREVVEAVKLPVLREASARPLGGPQSALGAY